MLRSGTKASPRASAMSASDITSMHSAIGSSRSTSASDSTMISMERSVGAGPAAGPPAPAPRETLHSATQDPTEGTAARCGRARGSREERVVFEKRIERLRLHRETVRELSGTELEQVAGAGTQVSIGAGCLPTQKGCTGYYPSLNAPCGLSVNVVC